MTRREYRKQRQALEAQLTVHESDAARVRGLIVALDRCWNEIFSKQVAATDSALAADGNSTGSGLIGQVISQTALHMGRDFTVLDVKQTIESTAPNMPTPIKRSTISWKLTRMAEDGELVVIEEGKGRRPTIYRRAGDANVSMKAKEELTPQAAATTAA